MSTYQTKRCPKCGRVYERNSYAGNPSKDNRTKYGSPLKYCVACRTPFIDDEYREIAVEGVRSADTMPVSPGGIVWSSMCMIMFLWSRFDGYSGSGIFLVPAVFFLWFDYSSYSERKIAIKILRIESEIRLWDYSYACMLNRLGYKVPKEYMTRLPDEEKRNKITKLTAELQRLKVKAKKKKW